MCLPSSKCAHQRDVYISLHRQWKGDSKLLNVKVGEKSNYCRCLVIGLLLGHCGSVSDNFRSLGTETRVELCVCTCGVLNNHNSQVACQPFSLEQDPTKMSNVKTEVCALGCLHR